MQANERIVGCSEQVGLDRKAFVVDQVAPLARCTIEKDRSERKRQKPPECEGANLSPLQRLHGKVNRQTARKQTNGEEDRGMQHLFGCRPRQTLTDVKEVSHHKNGKNRRLGRNQAVHTGAAAWRKLPRDIGGRDWRHTGVGNYCWRRTHGSPLLVFPVGIFGRLEIPQGSATADLWNRREVVGGRWRSDAPL